MQSKLVGLAVVCIMLAAGLTPATVAEEAAQGPTESVITPDGNNAPPPNDNSSTPANSNSTAPADNSYTASSNGSSLPADNDAVPGGNRSTPPDANGLPSIANGSASPANPSLENGAQLQKTPIYFEENLGQADANSTFIVRGAESAAFLTKKGIAWNLASKDHEVLQTEPGLGSNAPPRSFTHSGKPQRHVGVFMQLVDANNSAGEGLEPTGGISNYYRGTNADGWIVGARHFSKVSYHDVYPGIDLVWHAAAGQLEYDFVVGPNIDVSQIKLQFDGAKNLRLDAQGRLVVGTEFGNIEHATPVAFQENRAGGRSPVHSQFRLNGTMVTLEVGDYNRSNQLIIDPLIYSTLLAGANADFQITWATGLAADSNGNPVIAGFTTDTAFPTPGGHDVSGGGAFTGYLSKFNSDGSTLLYSTYYGGPVNGFTHAPISALAVDPNGAAFIVGETTGSGLPTLNAVQTTFAGPASGGAQYSYPVEEGRDAFAARFNADGTLGYSTYLGGTAYDGAYDVAVDGTGVATIVGYTGSTDFPMAYPWQATKTGSEFNAFVTRIASNGALIGSTYFGEGVARGAAVDAVGNTYVTGTTASASFPTANAIQPNLGNALGNAFVAKLGTDFAPSFSTYLGNSANPRAEAVAVDTSGNIWVTGRTAAGHPITPLAFQSTYRGGGDIFVTKYSNAGSAILGSTFLGGSYLDDAEDLVPLAGGGVLVVGTTRSNNFPTTPNRLQDWKGATGKSDAIVARLSSDVRTLEHSTFLGGGENDSGSGAAIAPNGDVLVGGDTASTTYYFPSGSPSLFPTTSGAYQQVTSASSAAFVARLTMPLFVNSPPNVCLTLSANYLLVTASSPCGDPDGHSATYTYAWGDGSTTSFVTTGAPSGASKDYQSKCPSGSVTVTLTATDQFGATASQSQTLSISDTRDQDNDGLYYCQETALQTLDSVGDTDGDGLGQGLSANVPGRGTMIVGSDFIESAHYPNRAAVFCPTGALAANCLPNPRHKDLYVELDYMGSAATHLPSDAKLAGMIEEFRAAAVANPDGVQGIVLHLDAGSARANAHNLGGGNSITHANYVGPVDDGDPTTDDCIGSGPSTIWAWFDTKKSENIAPNRVSLFHYGLFVHEFCAIGVSRGIPARDFIMGVNPDNGHADDSQRLGLLSHEYGHNIGLYHGGQPNGANFKPNYFSSMNYRAAYDNSGAKVHRYSSRGLGALNEAALDESKGLNPAGAADLASYLMSFKISFDCPRGTPADDDGVPPYYVSARADQSVNWDCDAMEKEAGVTSNINGRTLDDKDINEDTGGSNSDDCFSLGPSSGCEIHEGHDDWAAIQLGAPSSSSYGFGQAGPHAHKDDQYGLPHAQCVMVMEAYVAPPAKLVNPVPLPPHLQCEVV